MFNNYERKHVILLLKVKSESEVAQSCPTLCDPMDWSLPRPLHPWNFPGKDTGEDCHFLLQGIFPIQGSNPALLHCRQTCYHLSHQGSPRVEGCMLLFCVIALTLLSQVLLTVQITSAFLWANIVNNYNCFSEIAF